MRIFSAMYDRVLHWSAHRHANRYLAGLSFAESSFFPIPPDVMLAPMCLANNQRAVYYATLTTVFSVLGGILGYLIGMLAFDAIAPYIAEAGYQDRFDLATRWFAEWGVWVVFIAGFSPIPYKLFTIAAGAASMAFLPFVIVSLLGRGLRFFMVALLIRWGGERMEKTLRRYVEYLGWLVVVLAIGAYLILR
jgi:membrane protein YqaA with SNARE-associated domain